MLRTFLAVSIVVLPVLQGCGESTNFNQIWGTEDEAGDTLFVEAQAAYDAGDFEKAEKLATRLLERNSRNEQAAVLLGYINLSLGGIDPFRLARELVAISEEKQESETPAAGGSGLTQEQQSGESSNSTSSLRELAAQLINLSPADFDLMTADEPYAEGLFASTPIYVPEKITPEMRSAVTVLSYMDKAIKTICPFVSEDVKVPDVARYDDEDCVKVEAGQRNLAKAHFLWAFSHLTESLVYQLVLLYSSTGTTSNFEVAADTLNNGVYTDANGGIPAFLEDVTTMKEAVDTVFADTEDGSMLAETLNDLEAVNLAFGQLAGLPKGVTDRVSKALETIKGIGDKLGGGAQANAKALKGQMTEKMSKTVGGKIDGVIEQKLGTKEASPDFIDQQPFDDETKEQLKNDITAMCASYDSLAEGVKEETKAASEPAACKSF